MLNDPKSKRFVEDFTGQWLDLRHIDATTPDPQLYGEFDRYLVRPIDPLFHLLADGFNVDGVGNFLLESADISGVPLPKTFLQEVVSYYSRTEKNPQGVKIDDPFMLPASIRQIDVGAGQAVIVQ